jgi:hypothetical protein
VVGAGNDDEPDLRVLLEFRRHLFHTFYVAILVVLAVDQQQRLATRLKKLEVVLVERRADAD